MMKHTTAFHRAFMRILAPSSVLFTEMFTAEELLQMSDEALRFELPCATGQVLQLGGRDPFLLSQAVRRAIEVTGGTGMHVNLNVGCPSATIAGENQFGVALMLEPELTAACCDAMWRENTQGCVSVKCRIGVGDEEDAQEEDKLLGFLRTVREKGQVCDFQIHARRAILGVTPMQNRHVPPLNYKRVYSAARSLSGCRVEINGGIESVEEAKMHLAACPELSSVMIGRAVINHPYSFEQSAWDKTWPKKSRGEILDAYIAWVAAAAEFGGGPGRNVEAALSPVYSLFIGADDSSSSSRFQRKLLSLLRRGLSNPVLVLNEARKELSREALEGTSCKPLAQLDEERMTWLPKSKKSNAPMKIRIV